MRQVRTSLAAFSIIEVLIGIFVFSLGLVSIFALLASSLSVNEYSKNSLIASNIARANIELIRNVRDTNYKNLQLWNQYDLPTDLSSGDITDPNKVLAKDSYYKISYYMSSGAASIKYLGGSIPEGPAELGEMGNNPVDGYRLFQDDQGHYSYNPSSNPSSFYAYVYVQEAKDEGGNIIPEALKISSKVIWYKRGYHEYELETIITDWRRI